MIRISKMKFTGNMKDEFIVFYLQFINPLEGLGMFFSSAALTRRLRKYTATWNIFEFEVKNNFFYQNERVNVSVKGQERINVKYQNVLLFLMKHQMPLSEPVTAIGINSSKISLTWCRKHLGCSNLFTVDNKLKLS